MTYARLRSRWTGRVIIVGPFADEADAHTFAPDVSQDGLEIRLAGAPADDRARLEEAGALPLIDYDVEAFE
jgi:hypothetical protein